MNTTMLNIFQYDFVMRGMGAGLVIAIVAPLVGIFLVLRRYSLIADSLAHVSLAGIAVGLLAGVNPVLTAICATLLSSFGIERIRNSKKVYGESALALFLSGSLALAVVLLSLGRGLGANVSNYLFGSIVTVTSGEVWTIIVLAIVTVIAVGVFYKDLIYVSFDEEMAYVSGVRVRLLTTVLMLLSALVVSISIPIVGALLVSALMVIPVVTALQLRKNFFMTILWAEIVSVASVLLGMFVSFYLDISAGGVIVLIMIVMFAGVYITKKK